MTSTLAFTTVGSSALFISGTLQDSTDNSGGTSSIYSVEYQLNANNYNDFKSGVTYGEMSTSVESLAYSSLDGDEAPIVNTTMLFHYPYSITLDESNNQKYLYISAAVNYTCDKQVYIDNVLTSCVDTIDTTAIYNRSNDADRSM